MLNLPIRQPTPDEHRLLQHFFTALAARGLLPSADIDWLRVRDMNDGGMGSLELLDASGNRGKIHRYIADLQYEDLDGVIILVSIVVSRDGTPMEMDSWRVDYGPRQHIPADLPAVSVYPDGDLNSPLK